MMTTQTLLVVEKDDDSPDEGIDDDDNCDNDNLGSNCRLQAGVFGALLLAECWGWNQTKVDSNDAYIPK